MYMSKRSFICFASCDLRLVCVTCFHSWLVSFSLVHIDRANLPRRFSSHMLMPALLDVLVIVVIVVLTIAVISGIVVGAFLFAGG